MPITHGIASAPTLHVRCTAKHCPAPADTHVTLPILAPGVVGWPALRCVGCGSDLETVEV